MDHPFSTYAKFSEKLLFLTPLILTRMCAYQGVRNVSFFGKFCVRTKWMNPKSEQLYLMLNILHVHILNRDLIINILLIVKDFNSDLIL